MKRRFANDFFSYGIISGLEKLIGFILLPIYSRYLSIEDFGKIDISYSIIIFISFISSRGFSNSFNRYYQKGSDNKEVFVFHFLGINMISLFLSLIVVLFSEEMTLSIFNSVEYSKLFRLTAFVSIFQIGCEIPQQHLRRNQKFIQFGLMTLIQTISYPAISIYLLVINKWGLEGIFHALLFSYLIKFLLGILFTYKQLTYRVKFTNKKKYFLYALPYLPHSIIGWGNSQLSRYLVLYLFGDLSLGQFSAALKVCSIFIFLSNTFKNTWVPISIDLIHKSISFSTYKKVLELYFAIFSIIAFIFNLSTPIIVEIILPKEYHDILQLIPWFIGALIFQFCSDIVNLGSIIREKPIINTRAAFIGFVVFLLTSLLTYQVIGLNSIVLALYVSQFCSRYYLNNYTIGYFKSSYDSNWFLVKFLTLYAIYTFGFMKIQGFNFENKINFYLFGLIYSVIFIFLFYKILFSKQVVSEVKVIISSTYHKFTGLPPKKSL